jgi:hypothetical protein
VVKQLHDRGVVHGLQHCKLDFLVLVNIGFLDGHELLRFLLYREVHDCMAALAIY